MDYNELKKGYEAIAMFRELGLPVSDEQMKGISNLERQYLKEEIIPLIQQELESRVEQFIGDFKLRITYTPGQGLTMAAESADHEATAKPHNTVSGQDRTQYAIDGSEPLSKKRFVLEVVRRYVASHPDITLEELEQRFPSSLSHSRINGVVRTYDSVAQRAEQHPDLLTRFWMNEPISLQDGTRVVVYNQWGKNFELFLTVARELHEVRND